MLMIRYEGSGELFYATEYSAGFDIISQEDVGILPGEWKLVSTGLYIIDFLKPPILYDGTYRIQLIPELQIRSRSGLAYKHGIVVLNSPGTIDADYRGEVKVTLCNHSSILYHVHKGDRIAQGVCGLVAHIPAISVKKVSRGTGGFGSTGG